MGCDEAGAERIRDGIEIDRLGCSPAAIHGLQWADQRFRKLRGSKQGSRIQDVTVYFGTKGKKRCSTASRLARGCSSRPFAKNAAVQ